jgi:hypothetical protein
LFLSGVKNGCTKCDPKFPASVDECIPIRIKRRTAVVTKATLLKRTSVMTSKLVFVSLCAIALTGCAQFEDSFGELWDPGSVSGTAAGSDSQDSTRQNDRFDHRSNGERGNSLSANGAQSFTLGGIRVELADGDVIH